MECATLQVSYWRFFASLIAIGCHKTLSLLSEYPREWCYSFSCFFFYGGIYHYLLNSTGIFALQSTKDRQRTMCVTSYTEARFCKHSCCERIISIKHYEFLSLFLPQIYVKQMESLLPNITSSVACHNFPYYLQKGTIF